MTTCPVSAPVAARGPASAAASSAISGLGRTAVRVRAKFSQSMSATVTAVSSSSSACRRAATADSGAIGGMPSRRIRRSMASSPAMPPSAHGPQAIEVAGKPWARRSSASASK
ncbi:hypothetical protein SANTM175S_01011 [Streptomyces antimycoticus]